eukprot:scaffold810_cov363-Prasinococcus_capsulatus_cf.AAC.3
MKWTMGRPRARAEGGGLRPAATMPDITECFRERGTSHRVQGCVLTLHELSTQPGVVVGRGALAVNDAETQLQGLLIHLAYLVCGHLLLGVGELPQALFLGELGQLEGHLLQWLICSPHGGAGARGCLWALPREAGSCR